MAHFAKAKFYEVVQALETGRFEEATKITGENCKVKEFVEAEDESGGDAERCFMYRYRPIKRTGFSLLHYAALYSQVAMTKELIQHGADPLKTDKLGSTPLHYACLFGTEDCVKNLLSNVSEYFPDQSKKLVDLKNRVSWIPLYYAAERKNANLVKLLLDNGADPKYKPSKKWQRTALHFIAKFSSPECLAVVFKHGNCADATCWQDKNGQTALHLVCEDDNLDAAVMLLDNDPSNSLQDVKDTEGRTALSLAIKHGAEKCAMHLLDITKVSLTKNGSSDYYDLDLLKEAINAERPRIVLHILEAYEKSLGYAIPFGKSSMLYDVVQSDAYSDEEFVKIVAKLGKHCIEYSDEETGWTPMLFAAQSNAHRKLEILLDTYTRILKEGFFTPDKKFDERKSTYQNLMGNF